MIRDFHIVNYLELGFLEQNFESYWRKSESKGFVSVRTPNVRVSYVFKFMLRKKLDIDVYDN